jgi:hypothetical protein
MSPVQKATDFRTVIPGVARPLKEQAFLREASRAFFERPKRCAAVLLFGPKDAHIAHSWMTELAA